MLETQATNNDYQQTNSDDLQGQVSPSKLPVEDGHAPEEKGSGIFSGEFLNDVLAGTFLDPNKEEPSEDNENSEEGNQTKGAEESDLQDDSTQEGEEDETLTEQDFTITLRDRDFEKQLNLAKDEDFEYLVQHAQKGLNYERKMQEYNKQRHEVENMQNQLKEFANALAFQQLYLQSKGEIQNDLLEQPYENFIGKSPEQTEEGDIRLWNEHKQKVANARNLLNTYAENYAKSAQQFDKMVSEFQQKHKDIQDMDQWIKENVTPYHLPILTMGAHPYPEDTLEMIYFWKNKDKIIQQIKEEARKEIVKKPPIKISTTQKRGETMPSSYDDFFNQIFNDKRKILR